MLKTLFTPFATPSSQKQTAATMMVTSHDINFVMGFIKEEDMFTSSNASMSTRKPSTTSISSVSLIKPPNPIWQEIECSLFLKPRLCPRLLLYSFVCVCVEKNEFSKKVSINMYQLSIQTEYHIQIWQWISKLTLEMCHVCVNIKCNFGQNKNPHRQRKVHKQKNPTTKISFQNFNEMISLSTVDCPPYDLMLLMRHEISFIHIVNSTYIQMIQKKKMLNNGMHQE